MPVALLCVQFRNLLPSEDLLTFARNLWHDLQLQGHGIATGDATLLIAQGAGDCALFRAELTSEGAPISALGQGATALAAVREAFHQLGAPLRPSGVHEIQPLGNFASARSHRSVP